MNRFGVALLVGTVAFGCSSAPEPEPLPPPRPAAPVVATDPRVSELQIQVAELTERVEVLQARLSRLERFPVEQGSTTSAPGQSRTLSPNRIADAYRDARDLFKKGHLDLAKSRFLEVHAADPDGDLADNALYWAGEIEYVRGRTGEALELFRRVVSEHPEQNKTPDAMLKIGLCHARLGDLIMARRSLEQLISRYPYSEAAVIAKQELNALRY